MNRKCFAENEKLNEATYLRGLSNLNKSVFFRMKRLLLFIALIISVSTSNAQFSKAKIELSAIEHDFGTFKEEAGRQSFDFIITNSGTDPLIIVNVAVSCGCTKPEWPRHPIPAGGKSKITAVYDPFDRPGKFSKTLTVFTNTRPDIVVLTITGEVIPREKTIEELYPFAIGGIRTESQTFAFSSINKTEKKIKTMPIINASSVPVKVEFIVLPKQPHLTFKISSEILKPGEKGFIEGTYDATKNSAWGNINETIKMKINGIIQENNLDFYISATLVEDFSLLSKEDILNGPTLKMASPNVDLGKIKYSTQNPVEFKFTNTGKKDLIIRHISSTCGCIVIKQGNRGVGIKPGESSSIKVTFNSSGYNGKVTKVMYVYTNDPKNSELLLILNADVEPPITTK
jgi:hypothetical protein